jgi:hypothetical protein
MKIFDSFSLTWWQLGFFKTGLVTCGIAIGAYWSEVLSGHLYVLISVAAVCLVYVAFIRLKQIGLFG